MHTKSFIYQSLPIYRLIMNILYRGKYNERFYPVIEYIKQLPPGSSVLELCFGDVFLADYCKRSDFRWTGFDINEHFVTIAQRKGYDAHQADLEKLGGFPKADICIMMGSLYHFHPNVPVMLAKMLRASKTVVISEPISNLSSSNGIIGFLARRSANAGKGNESFRFQRESFLAMLNENAPPLDYAITATQDNGKDIIVKLCKR